MIILPHPDGISGLSDISFYEAKVNIGYITKNISSFKLSLLHVINNRSVIVTPVLLYGNVCYKKHFLNE